MTERLYHRKVHLIISLLSRLVFLAVDFGRPGLWVTTVTATASTRSKELERKKRGGGED